MISRQEVMDFSREFGLGPQVIEKDYVLGWILAGINKHAGINDSWVFKGGTCLKKCFFETYRFSEDLDFTITNEKHLEPGFLKTTFSEVVDWVYGETGAEIPADRIRFIAYENPRGETAVEGRIYYRGPLQRRGDMARIKLDISADEILVLDAVQREVHHPYSDRPQEGIQILSYCYEEVFAEKIRALGERERPRDLYDVVHLYRHDDMRPDRDIVLRALQRKCEFKGVPVPTMEALEHSPNKEELIGEWENMLAHQLPALPPFEDFWDAIHEVFDWLHEIVEKVTMASIPATREETEWRPPPMATAWHMGAPLEIIRFAAVNRLCVKLGYQGSFRLIEPYALRKTKDDNLILHAVKHDTGEDRTYRVDRIQSAEATKTAFKPRYGIELTASGPLNVLPASRKSSMLNMPSLRGAATAAGRRTPARRKTISSGPTYVIECPYCHKKFYRKKNDTRLNKHKDKNGYPCGGRTGYQVDVRY